MAGIAAGVLSLVTLLGEAQEPEQQVKAAFIYKFCAYIKWPENSFADHTSPFIIGVAGSSNTVRQFEQVLQGKFAVDRPLHVRLIRQERDIEGIHILYLEQDWQKKLADFPALRGEAPILTITEEYQIPKYGIINFVLEEGYIRFEIAKSRAEAVGLQMSSELLAVASKIQ